MEAFNAREACSAVDLDPEAEACSAVDLDPEAEWSAGTPASMGITIDSVGPPCMQDGDVSMQRRDQYVRISLTQGQAGAASDGGAQGYVPRSKFSVTR